MGDQHPEDRDEPSLELPSLFRRMRRRGADADPASPASPAPTAPTAPPPSPAEQLVDEQDEQRPPRYVEQAPPRPAPEVAPEPTPGTTVTLPHEAPADQPDDQPADGEQGSRRRLARPVLPAAVAAVLTGLVVGLAGTGLTYGGLEGCQVVRGTSSCGGPGLLLLVAILAAMTLVGAGLLAAFRVADARSTSVLAVGLVCVVAMVALLEVVFSAWMFVVVPLLSAVAYLVAVWVTSRVVTRLDDGPDVDVR